MFDIVRVEDDASDLIEQLGTKPKFWFTQGETKVLFKESRPHTGEHWAEKIASVLCGLVGLPHADYELAVWKGRRGVVTPTFVADGARLVHGNELLAQIERTYRTERIWRARQHTVRRVIASLKQPIVEIGPPLGFSEGSALDAFAGYLALDALIGNQDRHHENWGVIVGADGDVRLAPTYDHASSLGRNEKDAVRRRKLTTRDAGDSVESYVARATSALYRSSGDSKALPTLESFRLAGQSRPETLSYWINVLSSVRLRFYGFL